MDEAVQYPDCGCCKDTGIVGGNTYQFAFCKCKAGIAREQREPNLIAQANENRKKLYGMFKPHGHLQPHASK